MLALEDAGRRFRGGAGVEHLTLHVDPGEIVALVGLNGAGKTTLMRIALGMLRAQTGTVRLFDRPSTGLPAEVWAEVGVLVGTPLCYPELTVRENLHVADLLHGDGHRNSDNVEDSIRSWDLCKVADRRFRHLSAGNRQRTGLAAAMQHDPRLIVLDEPSNALDPASVILLRDQLTRRARKGTAILVSSHHLDEVARLADRTLLMNAGRLIGELEATGHDLERVFFERIRSDDEQRRSTKEVTR